MQRWMWAGLAAGAVLVSATSCTLPDFLHPRQPTPTAAASPPAAGWDDFTVSALPAYRLIATPWLADSPSRLLVVQLRLSASRVGALSVAPEDMQLVLANGEQGHVFDRSRAFELLRRTTLADGNLSYLQRGDHSPGGLDRGTQLQLADAIGSQLLTGGVFTADQGLDGFVVVDTGAVLPSLDGASLQVIAYRLADSAPARGVYRFTAPPPTETP